MNSLFITRRLLHFPNRHTQNYVIGSVKLRRQSTTSAPKFDFDSFSRFGAAAVAEKKRIALHSEVKELLKQNKVEKAYDLVMAADSSRQLDAHSLRGRPLPVSLSSLCIVIRALAQTEEHDFTRSIDLMRLVMDVFEERVNDNKVVEQQRLVDGKIDSKMQHVEGLVSESFVINTFVALLVAILDEVEKTSARQPKPAEKQKSQLIPWDTPKTRQTKSIVPHVEEIVRLFSRMVSSQSLPFRLREAMSMEYFSRLIRGLATLFESKNLSSDRLGYLMCDVFSSMPRSLWHSCATHELSKAVAIVEAMLEYCAQQAGSRPAFDTVPAAEIVLYLLDHALQFENLDYKGHLRLAQLLYRSNGLDDQLLTMLLRTSFTFGRISRYELTPLTDIVCSSIEKAHKSGNIEKVRKWTRMVLTKRIFSVPLVDGLAQRFDALNLAKIMMLGFSPESEQIILAEYSQHPVRADITKIDAYAVDNFLRRCSPFLNFDDMFLILGIRRGSQVLSIDVIKRVAEKLVAESERHMVHSERDVLRESLTQFEHSVARLCFTDFQISVLFQHILRLIDSFLLSRGGIDLSLQINHAFEKYTGIELELQRPGEHPHTFLRATPHIFSELLRINCNNSRIAIANRIYELMSQSQYRPQQRYILHDFAPLLALWARHGETAKIFQCLDQLVFVDKALLSKEAIGNLIVNFCSSGADPLQFKNTLTQRYPIVDDLLSPIAYQHLVYNIMRSGDYDSAYQLIDEMKFKNINVDGQLVYRLVQGYCENADPQSAFIFVQEIKRGGRIVPTSSCMNPIIKSFAQRDDLAMILEVIKWMLAEKFKPDIAGLGMIAAFLFERNANEQALQIIHDAESLSGHTLDIEFFNTILWTCARNGQSESIELVLNEMKQRNISADTQTYVALINDAAKNSSSKSSKMAQLLQNMKKAGVPRNAWVYRNIVMSVAQSASSSASPAVLELLGLLRDVSKDIGLDAAIPLFHTAIDYLLRKEDPPVEVAQEILIEMLRQCAASGRHPPVDSCYLVLESLTSPVTRTTLLNNMDAVEQFWNLLQRQWGVPMTAYLCDLLLRGYLNAQHTGQLSIEDLEAKCSALFSSMKKSKLSPRDLPRYAEYQDLVNAKTAPAR